LAKYDHEKYVETRRFSTRENAVKYVKNVFDKYDFDADEEETEVGEWRLTDADENLDIKFVLLITILGDKPGSSYHRTLGVKRNATKEEIKAAYRKKARESHPDTGGSSEQFKRVNEAYNKLINDEVKSGGDNFSDAYSSANIQFILSKGFAKATEEMSDQLLEGARRVAGKKIAIGLAWAVGGGILTAVTYNAASDGGSYFVFWGAILFGIWDILKGLYWLVYPQGMVNEAIRDMDK
jgi:hypothetical protein